MIVPCNEFDINNFTIGGDVPLTDDDFEKYDLYVKKGYILVKHYYYNKQRFVLESNVLRCDEGLINWRNPYREFAADQSLQRVIVALQEKFRSVGLPLFHDGIRIKYEALKDPIYAKIAFSLRWEAKLLEKSFASLVCKPRVILTWKWICEVMLLVDMEDILVNAIRMVFSL